MDAEARYAQARQEYDAAREAADRARDARDAARERMYVARDAARAARLSHGSAIGGVVIGSGGGLVADEITGGIHSSVSIGSVDAGEIVVGGRIINHGVAKQCRRCGGTRGWQQSGDVLRHTECGAVQ